MQWRSRGVLALLPVILPVSQDSSARVSAFHCRAGAAGGLTAQVDEAVLRAALPLAPGASLTVPIFLHPAQVR